MKDIKDVNIKDKTPINALPEYTIRTMKDDLAKISLKEMQKEAKEVEKAKTLEEKIKQKEVSPPDKLPVAPSKAPLPSTEELIIEPSFAKKAPEGKKPTGLPSEAPSKARGKGRKFSIYSIILILLLVGIGAFLYWQGTLEPLPPEPGPQPQPQPPQPSASLIPVDKTEIISLTLETKLFDLLKQEAELDQSTGTFKRVAVLKTETEFLSLIEIFQNLKVTIPPYALAELKENYTLVLYNQNGKRHLGIIVEIENADNLKEQLRFWEQTMIEDLENFFLGKSRGEPSTPNFQDNVYPPDSEAGKEIAIRYINFPEPDLTIDYALVNNLFVLTTSRETIYRIIDKIKL